MMQLEPDSEAQDDNITPAISRQMSKESVRSQISHNSSFEEKCEILRMSSTEEGPSAFRKQSSFGGTIKLKPAKKGESSIVVEKGDHYAHAEKVGKWKKYNHLGQTLARVNVVDTFGKLMTQPGPLDYYPLTEKRSTQRSDPHWSFYDRDKYNGSVDALNTPGPGTYLSVPAIVAEEPRFRRHRRVKVDKPASKVGPGSYNVKPNAVMATQRFHRETSAQLPKRDNGSKTREILDFNTLKIKKNKQKRKKDEEKNKIYDEKSHLGPGAYFPVKSQVPASVCTSSDSTLPVRKTFDHDPDIRSTYVPTFSVRRPDLSLGKDQETPGPGQYDYFESLYGSQPLLEGGGTASRPGKGSSTTTDSEGVMRGQHANLDFATKFIPPLPSMKTTMKVNDISSSGKWVSIKEKKAERSRNYKSPYAAPHKKVERIQRNVGRGTESTAQDLPFKFSGRQSIGAFFKFH